MPSHDEVAPSSPAAHPRAWSWAKSGSAEPTGVAGIASRQQPLRARADSPLASATANAHVTLTEQCLWRLRGSPWQCSDPPSKTVHALTCGPCTVCSSTSLHAHGTLWTCHKHRCVTHCRTMARGGHLQFIWEWLSCTMVAPIGQAPRGPSLSGHGWLWQHI